MSDKSELSHARNQFYRPGSSHAASRKEITTSEAIERFKNVNDPHRRTTTALLENESGQHLNQAQAKFWGENYKPSDQGSEMGSIFQHNAAEFYGLDMPEKGEKPFKINKDNFVDPNKNKKPTSVLNERKLKEHEMNMQRNPTFSKDLRRFYGMKSYGKI